MRKIILFDLDGTLIESGEGIINSLKYAFKKMNLPVPSTEELRVFIGPPLLEQFMLYADLSEEEAQKSVDFYHERYLPIGLYEAHPYEQVKEMLITLKENGCELGIASSKPEELVIGALTHFKLNQYFTEIIGSSPLLKTKGKVIKEALHRLSADKVTDKIVMVGDKEHDVLGAREEGLECISVLYGYGTLDELEAVSPRKIVSTVTELNEELLK